VFPPLRLLVRTPEAVLLNTSGVLWVQARLADGAGIGILPGHGPLLAETVAGRLEYADGDGDHVLTVRAGVLRVESGQVTIYTSERNDAD